MRKMCLGDGVKASLGCDDRMRVQHMDIIASVLPLLRFALVFSMV